MLYLLHSAAKIAGNTDLNEKRNFLLGAVGIRQDGAIISAKNGAVISSTFDDYRIVSDAHAECRAIKKMGKNGILFVARVLKKDGSLAMARPCPVCRQRIQYAKVKKVTYTIDTNHYGIWDPIKDRDQIYEF